MTTYEHYALVIPDGFVQLNYIHTMPGVPDQIICSIGAEVNTFVAFDATMLALASAWETNMLINFSDDLIFEKLTASDAGGVIAEYISGEVGSQAGAMAPISNAVICEKRTGVSGRRNRGRMYLPAVLESAVDEGGHLTTVYQGGLQGDADAYLTEFQGIASIDNAVILHSKGWDGGSEPADPGNAPAPTAITSLYVKNLIGTQRRRIR